MEEANKTIKAVRHFQMQTFYYLALVLSVTRSAKFRPFGKFFNNICRYLEGFINHLAKFSKSKEHFYAFRQIFIVVNGLI